MDGTGSGNKKSWNNFEKVKRVCVCVCVIACILWPGNKRLSYKVENFVYVFFSFLIIIRNVRSSYEQINDFLFKAPFTPVQ